MPQLAISSARWSWWYWCHRAIHLCWNRRKLLFPSKVPLRSQMSGKLGRGHPGARHSRCWLEQVRRRDAATLERIISDHVLPGSTVVTDAWGGYINVGTMNHGVYQHQVVVRVNNFVDPIDADIYTQKMEGLWMHAKRKLRYQSGTSWQLFGTYLLAFKWRFSHKTNIFGNYLCLLSDNYHIRLSSYKKNIFGNYLWYVFIKCIF